MRKISRQGYRPSGGENSFWLSFSDLMSALLLIFILIMFYIMYQYFDMYEISMAEIARQQFDLDQANSELASQQEKLTQSEQQMIAQQIRLDAAQKDLEDAEAILSSQQEELSKAQSMLTEKENEIAAQQEALDALSIQLGQQQTQIADQQQQLDNQQQQIEALVGVRTKIISALSQALRSANINAIVDGDTGAITLESDVLFSTGQSTLSAEGKQKIDEFLPVYLNVLFSEEYGSYVSEIIIEGHTDSVGGYLSNLELSQQRALAVASYVLGDSCRAVSADVKNQLRPVVTVNGRSFSDRIFNESGVEDMAASRRVVFKFRLTDEQMIQQLRQILEAE